MPKPSRKDNMDDLDSCNEELEEMIDEYEKDVEENTRNKKDTVQAKVVDEILKRGGTITWGNPKT